MKLSLPIALSPSHHLLFTFYHISCDVAKVTKAKSSVKQPPPETVGEWVREGGVREGVREGGREGVREGGREGGSEGGREGGSEGGREGGRE